MARKKSPGNRRARRDADNRQSASRITATADECNPGRGWHVYNGQALGFTMGRRWVDFVFISPGVSERVANLLLEKIVFHIAFVDDGQYQDLAKGWIVTQHEFMGSPDWFVLTRTKEKCSYIATSGDLLKAFGIRIALRSV